jgi:CheY-like chemotaxis protein
MSIPKIMPKVLVVDDSEIAREVAALTLEEQGYQVVTMDSPLGFSNTLRKEQPDLVLMDISMPALQGDKLVELASRNVPAGCSIVLHSDRPEEELARLSAACGAKGFIRKTGDAREFLRLVQKFIAK